MLRAKLIDADVVAMIGCLNTAMLSLIYLRFVASLLISNATESHKIECLSLHSCKRGRVGGAEPIDELAIKVTSLNICRSCCRSIVWHFRRTIIDMQARLCGTRDVCRRVATFWLDGAPISGQRSQIAAAAYAKPSLVWAGGGA